MQEIVDAMNGAAEEGGSFGRIEDHLVESAKKDDYPLHYAWERSGTFTQEFRRSQVHDTEATASFAIVARQDNYTYDQLETLFKDLVGRARSQKKGLEPVDFDAFGAHFGGTKVRLVIYEMRLDTNTQF